MTALCEALPNLPCLSKLSCGDDGISVAGCAWSPQLAEAFPTRCRPMPPPPKLCISFAHLLRIE
jgi:hypothetical protein|eukprot:COSAG01_NODE_16662_length_1217_cov_0.718247_3_plen_64_part_00